MTSLLSTQELILVLSISAISLALLVIFLFMRHHTVRRQFDSIMQEKHSLQQIIAEQQQGLSDNQHLIGQLSKQAEQADTYLQMYLQTSDKLQQLKVDLASQQASFSQQKTAFEEKIQTLERAEQRLGTQFENIANKIFEQKSTQFSHSSKQSIEALLNPFKHQIDNFTRTISDQYVKEGQERASLKHEILNLQKLNAQITQEAAALTNALKGDNKQQGNWGELVLERILSESGLRKGHEYDTQSSFTNEQGKQLRPDVIVHLPNNKDIIIDSKVSLIAHEQYVNAIDEQAAKRALDMHVQSVKGHIKGLSKKDYQKIEGIGTLDYVLLFIPIESAFLNAVEHDKTLLTLALDNQIMLVSPTNLLVALRTIHNIWQYEYQNQNAKVIAESARKLYDKFYGFVADIEKLGRSLDTAHNQQQAALNKLTSGKGNLLRQVEKFRELGVSPTKKLSDFE